jgi:hypothetical protein
MRHLWVVVHIPSMWGQCLNTQVHPLTWLYMHIPVTVSTSEMTLRDELTMKHFWSQALTGWVQHVSDHGGCTYSPLITGMMINQGAYYTLSWGAAHTSTIIPLLEMRMHTSRYWDQCHIVCRTMHEDAWPPEQLGLRIYDIYDRWCAAYMCSIIYWIQGSPKC